MYLGFGVISTNAALRHRSSGVGGSLFAHQWSRNQLGYLPAAAMSFALAMWWLVRGADPASTKQIQRALEANQGAWFRESLGWLRKGSGELVDTLGLPPKERWPAPLEPGAIAVRALPEHDSEEDEKAEDSEPELEEGVVFRLLKRRPWEQTAGMLVRIGVGISRWFTGTPALGVASTVGALAWLFWGATWTDRCSDPTCDHDLADSNSVCSGCHRPIAGTIKHRNERLAAEERLVARSRG